MRLSEPSRRHFLRAAGAAAGSLVLPSGLGAATMRAAFWFVSSETAPHVNRAALIWPVAGPVKWVLEHRREVAAHAAIWKAGDLEKWPLEHFREREKSVAEELSILTSDDGDRVIRLVVGQCNLNPLEHSYLSAPLSGDVAIQQRQADARPLVKRVVLWDPEREIVTERPGDDFLFGIPTDADFPLYRYLSKWTSRFAPEPDDWEAAPRTWSGYAWENIESNRIPWAAMKSAWRRTSPMICPNCGRPALLTHFGYPWSGMCNRNAKFVHACAACRRSFRDRSVTNAFEWMRSSLDPEVRPAYGMVWDRRKVIRWPEQARGPALSTTAQN